MKNLKYVTLATAYMLLMGISYSASSSNILLDFTDDQRDWKAGCAEYFVSQQDMVHFVSGIQQIPDLGQQKGYRLASTNVSDDIFMFVTTKLTNLIPNKDYNIKFTKLIYATNEPAGQVGTGGAPGESVWVKTGASVCEPKTETDDNDYIIMNIDKGVQSNNGKSAFVIGNFAKTSGNRSKNYELKTVTSTQKIKVNTNSDGDLWLLFGTDSGFESRTDIYFVSGNIKISPAE